MIDAVHLGFIADVAQQDGQPLFLYDTAVPGNGNGGHTGKAYGTELATADKVALVEYLKTF